MSPFNLLIQQKAVQQRATGKKGWASLLPSHTNSTTMTAKTTPTAGTQLRVGFSFSSNETIS